MKLNLKNLTASLVIGVCAVASSYGMENFGLAEVSLNVDPQINQAKFTEQANRYLHARNVAGVNMDFSNLLNVVTSLGGNFSTAARIAIKNEVEDKLLNDGDNLNNRVSATINGNISEYTPFLLSIKEVEKQSSDRINAFSNIPLLPQLRFNKGDVLHHIDLLNNNISETLGDMLTNGLSASYQQLGNTQIARNNNVDHVINQALDINASLAANLAKFMNLHAMGVNYKTNIDTIRNAILAEDSVSIASFVDIYANCCAISLIADNSIDVKNEETITAAINAARSNLNEALTASFFGIVAHMNAHQGNADAAIRHFREYFMTSLSDSFCADGGHAFGGYEQCREDLNSLITGAYRYLQHGFECDSYPVAADVGSISNDDVNSLIRDSYNNITRFVADHNRKIEIDQLNGVQNSANPIAANRADALQQTLNIVNIKCAEVNQENHNH